MKPLRIGPLLISPPVLQAPMAGFTNYAYRQIVRRLGGVGLPATEMLSARGFLGRDARGRPLPERLWGVADEPRPLAVQIWDNDPDTLAAVGAAPGRRVPRQRGGHQFRLSRPRRCREGRERLLPAARSGSRGPDRRTAWPPPVPRRR